MATLEGKRNQPLQRTTGAANVRRMTGGWRLAGAVPGGAVGGARLRAVPVAPLRPIPARRGTRRRRLGIRVLAEPADDRR